MVGRCDAGQGGPACVAGIERSGPIEAWFLRSGRRKFCRAVARSREVEEVGFAVDSPLEGAVHCELVSEVKIPAPVTKLGADSGRVMG